jgi:(1->4)-alpha-D-glucan 1-alpha-D-glucosylmutase
LGDWRDARIKLRIVNALLDLRRRAPQLFESGPYEPLKTTGSNAESICTFIRRNDNSALIIAVSLFFADHEYGEGWADTGISLPDGTDRRWSDVFSTRELPVNENTMAAKDLSFALFPLRF